MAKKEESVSKDKLEAALERLNKTYGSGTILSMDSKASGSYDVIKSGSISMDWVALGIGGWARGRVYELMGWEGTGKTTICAHAVAECQAAGGNVLYIDGEHAVDKHYLQALGVDTTKLYITQPSTGEEGFNIALEMINTGKIALVIIDSDSSLQPKDVVDGDVGDSSIGKKARLNNSAYPKIKTAAANNNTCVIVVSQFREKIGVMFGSPTTTQGGHALKFYSDGRMEVSKSLQKDKDDVISANKTKVKVTKNKMAPPYRVAEFDILYGQGIDKVKEVVTMAEEYGIIQKSGSWYSYKDSKLGQGADAVKHLLLDNPELYEEIQTLVIECVRGIEFQLAPEIKRLEESA